MGNVNGNIEITFGSEIPVTLQLLQDDGETPIGDITTATALTLYLREPDGDLVQITSNFVVSDGPNSEVTLSQTAAQFPDVIQYKYKVRFALGGKVYFVPDGSKWLSWKVCDTTP